MSKDVSDMVKSDVQKFKKVRQMDGSGWSIPAIMEYTFWTLALLSVIGMLAAMPFVGPDKAIPGAAWLAGSLGGMSIFGGLAFVIKQLPDV